MEWIAVGIAVIAALAAVWQAWEARRARTGAQTAAGEAKSHEARAADAAERTARAMEEQIAMERAEREKYRNPWEMIRTSGTWGHAVEYRLGGDEALTGVKIKSDDTIRERLQTRAPIPDPIRPRQAIVAIWSRTMTSPTSLDLTIEWTRPNGETHESVLTVP